LRRMYHRLGTYFGHNRWYSNVTWVKSKLVLVHLEILLFPTQDWCMICAECTMGIEIILGAPDGTPMKWKHVLVCLEIVLISTHDRSTACIEHTIGSEIILGVTNGTPM
jgi:hypothetical protein